MLWFREDGAKTYRKRHWAPQPLSSFHVTLRSYLVVRLLCGAARCWTSSWIFTRWEALDARTKKRIWERAADRSREELQVVVYWFSDINSLISESNKSNSGLTCFGPRSDQFGIFLQHKQMDWRGFILSPPTRRLYVW